MRLIAGVFMGLNDIYQIFKENGWLGLYSRFVMFVCLGSCISTHCCSEWLGLRDFWNCLLGSSKFTCVSLLRNSKAGIGHRPRRSICPSMSAWRVLHVVPKMFSEWLSFVIHWQLKLCVMHITYCIKENLNLVNVPKVWHTQPWSVMCACGTSAQKYTSTNICDLALYKWKNWTEQLHIWLHHVLDVLFANQPRILDFCPRFGNAKYWANYLNEDFIGRVKNLGCIIFCVATLKNLKPNLCDERGNLRKIVLHSHVFTMSKRVLEHYTVTVCLRWFGPNALTEV